MSTESIPQLHISSSPHIREKRAVPHIMRDVIIALIPTIIASYMFFGVRAIIMSVVAVFAAIFSEYIISTKMLKQNGAVRDWSAVITGILIAANMPVSAPLWMAALASFFAIAVAKWAFGGLGNNFINPALAGRAFLMASYPAEMTGSAFMSGGKWGKVPELLSGIEATTGASVTSSGYDAISCATPLAALPEMLERGVDIQTTFSALFFGNVGGCLGETSVFAILLGAIYLLYRRVIGFTIPVTMILTVFFLYLIFNGIEGASPLSSDAMSVATYQILSGGLFFGAVFMATDMVTSPITVKGQFIFALGAGILTFMIRKFGGYPEGVSYSILLMNLLVPLIDRYVKPRVYGTEK